MNADGKIPWPPKVYDHIGFELLDELVTKSVGFDDYVYISLVVRFQMAAGGNLQASMESVNEFLGKRKIRPPNRRSLKRTATRVATAVLLLYSQMAIILASFCYFVYPFLLLWMSNRPAFARQMTLPETPIAASEHIAVTFAWLSCGLVGNFMLNGYHNSPRRRIPGKYSLTTYALTAVAMARSAEAYLS